MSELTAVVDQYAEKLDALLTRLVPSQPTEVDFRRPVDELLNDFCEAVGIQPMSHTEYTVASGRADTVFNRLIIEYKRPGVLGPNLTRRAVRDATAQLVGYMTSLAQGERHQLPRIGGAVFDGTHVIFVRVREGHLVVEDPVSADRPALSRLLHWMVALSSGVALTPENLVRDFSIDQLRTQRILRQFKSGLDSALANGEPLTRGLFRQWQLFFSESIDYQEAFGGRKLEGLRRFAHRAGIDVRTAEDAERFFFVLHTYFALLVKLLGWLALSRHLGAKLGGPVFGQLASRGDDALRGQLEEMESGGIFRQYGLVNLLEGDFFLWYLHAWNDDIACALRDLLNRLDDYDPTTLTIHPEETRDLFKKLYHYLLPREVRHNLGEYYTPDWLAQRLLTQVDNDFFTTDPARGAAQPTLRRKLRELRWLDPACGSGTFPILIIQRYLEIGRELMVNEADLLEWITANIVGFDLNPLAVMTARVNYLLAIADLLEHRRGEVTIPIYLADSIATPSLPERQLDMETGGGYRLTTAVGRFLIPREAFEHDFDGFCELLDRSVRAGLSAQAFCQQATQELGLQLDTLGQTILGELCGQLGDLHRQGLNGLWARLIKNNFAPLTVGRFDYVVGNPPWINWEHLPDGYREDTRDLWTRYQLAGTFTGGRPRLGAVKVDISALMTYVAMDAYLKPRGRLGFVITQAVFKTAGAGRGFRRFAIPQSKGPDIPLRVVHVDDMVELQPFEGASNRTTVAILDRGSPTRYPVSYTLWRKTRGLPRGQGLTYDHTLKEVFKITQRHNLKAEPVQPDDPTSSWLTAPKPALQGLRKVRGASPYAAHAGICTWANAVYFVEKLMERPDGLVVISNITEGTKVEVPQVREVVEPDLLYPLLRGRDVRRWRAEPSGYILVPQDPTTPNRAYPEAALQAHYPRTYGYLKRFEEVLRARSGYKQILSRRESEFYGLMDIDDYTFAPWKVVWSRIASDIMAAVVGCYMEKPVLPQETITLVVCATSPEAHFLCALMNSVAMNAVISMYSQRGGKSFGTPYTLENIDIPKFQPRHPIHVRLAELSEEAHQLAESGDKGRVAEIEAEIDELAAGLWGLTKKELQAIRNALEIIS